jgi:hypothetical protein
LLSALTDETGTGSAVFATSPTLVTPILGTPTSATLTNATGLPIATGVSGLGSGVATFLATPSSANLAAALTDETGTGSAVFATSPTLVTPVLGVATATSLQGIIGNVTPAAGAFTTLGATGDSSLATTSVIGGAGTAAGLTALTVGDATNATFRMAFTNGPLIQFAKNSTVAFAFGSKESSSGTFTEQMRISAVGNVAIGTTSPVGSLTVQRASEAATIALCNTASGDRYGYIFSTTGTTTNDLTISSELNGANTERARIPSTGGIQSVNSISVGNATPTTSGAGITFPATQSASSNANTLDDYEEGTWTPELVGGTTTGTPVAGAGYYTKVGNLVTIFYQFEGVATPSGAAGTLFVRGMPFTLNSASTIYSYNNPGMVFTNGATSLANMWWSHRVDETVNTRWSFQYTANANNAPVNLEVTNLGGSGNYLRGYFSYQV